MDDGHLIQAHLRGDQLAFEMLFRKYREHVAKLVYSVLKDASLVDDIVQDVFISVYRHLPKFRGDSAFKTWLYRITVNESLRQISRRKRWQPMPENDQDGDTLPSTMVVYGSEDNPERVLIDGEQKKLIEKALDGLRPKHRMVLVLYYIEELTVGEIAEILEIPEGSVKSRLYYARMGLKDILEDTFSQKNGKASGKHHAM